HRHHAHGGIQVGALEHREQGVDHGRIDRVPLVRPVERGRENPGVDGHDHSIRHRGSSTTRRNSAVENTFPWASVLSEMVPPPSNAPCSRKFNARKFGSSNRSTGPVTIPLKWRGTRAAGTCFTRIGEYSVLRAIRPTFAVSPLSPDRAWASSSSRTRLFRDRVFIPPRSPRRAPPCAC